MRETFLHLHGSKGNRLFPFLQGVINAFMRETLLLLHGSKGNRPFCQGAMNALNALVLPRLRRQRSGHGAYK